jgi:glycosyltransferase involved in cell wall biosynthesis
MKVAVVIPAYRCKNQILEVLAKVPATIEKIFVVDDKCPENTGIFVKEAVRDPRLEVIFRQQNGGVGAAMVTGYQRALETDCDVFVKVDGDNQMDLSLLGKMVQPILTGEADYTKGNRFYYPKHLVRMPLHRVWGNAVLSLMAKISTGYYNIFDPNNGYTAIHREALNLVELEKLSPRFFFETDLLFRLNIIRAVTIDIPMSPIYNSENSNLNPIKIIPSFLAGHSRNFTKRMIYSYFLRGFSVASVCFLAAIFLSSSGLAWLVWHWVKSHQSGVPATIGTIVIGIMPLLLGFQFMIHFFIFDMAEQPKRSIQPNWRERNDKN